MLLFSFYANFYEGMSFFIFIDSVQFQLRKDGLSIFSYVTLNKWQLGLICKTIDYSNISKPLLDLQ